MKLSRSPLLVLVFVMVACCERSAYAAGAESYAPTSTGVPHRTIYVSLTGDDEHDGLKPATALRTPQLAADRSEPGDTILFAEGEYDAVAGATLLKINRSGAPGKPIIYASVQGAKVVLHSRDAWEAISITGTRHIEIRGFRVIGSAQSVTSEEARREMSNLKNPRTCGNGIGVNQDPDTKTPSAYITVRNCEVSDCSGGGIFASHTDYLTFANNVVYRCAFWSPYGNSGISVYEPTAIDDSKGYKILIRDNVCFENYQNIPFFHSNEKEPEKRKVTDGNGIIIDDYLNTQEWGHGTGQEYPGHTLVMNNVVFANGGSGIHSFKSCNVEIVHNYAADNNRHPQLKSGQIFGNSSKNLRILNNVMVAPVGKPVTTNSKNTNLVMDHNLYASLDDGPPVFEGDKASNVVASPGLKIIGWSEGKRTFTATQDSPLRGMAIPLPEFGSDFFGKVWDPSAPDIGPFVLGQR